MFNWIKKTLSRKKEQPNKITAPQSAIYESQLNQFEEEHGEYYVEIPDGWVGKYDPVDTVNGYEEDWTYG